MNLRFTIVLAVLLVCFAGTAAFGQTTVNIATVNNPDMIIMQNNAYLFEKLYPDISIRWVILPEEELRARVTTDVATAAGTYDIITVGNYEATVWGPLGWLSPFTDIPEEYDVDDLIGPIRDSLSYEGEIYALPFYGESTATFYRKDVFEQAGLEMPYEPTWFEIAEFAQKLHNPPDIFGIGLRGFPGWGANMALVNTLVNTFGGRWFDMDWEPQLTSPEWQEAIDFYLYLCFNYNPPGVTGNSFTELEAIFADGRLAMWPDATVAAGYLTNPRMSAVADEVGFAFKPYAHEKKGYHWSWAWSLAVPNAIEEQKPEVAEAARKFIYWATSREYVETIGESVGWGSVPPGTRVSTYEDPRYKEEAEFADIVLEAIMRKDILNPTRDPVPYTGIQWLSIPEWMAIGDLVGRYMTGAIAGDYTAEEALEISQGAVERIMTEAGYYD